MTIVLLHAKVSRFLGSTLYPSVSQYGITCLALSLDPYHLLLALEHRCVRHTSFRQK